MPLVRLAHTRGTIAVARMTGATRKRGRIPRQQPPDRIAKDYSIALRARVQRVEALIKDVWEVVPGLLATASRERRDANEGRRVAELADRVRESMGKVVSRSDVEQLAERFAHTTTSYQRVQLERQTRAALGVDVVTGDKGLRTRIEGFAQENVALIRGLNESIITDVEKATMRAVQDGKLWTDLSTELQDRYAIGQRRADLIARDQVGKLYGQINAARQKELGVTHFFWRTVNDERVRDEHEARNGERYSYDSPPDGELPGEPILCRCSADPDFGAILDDL